MTHSWDPADVLAEDLTGIWDVATFADGDVPTWDDVAGEFVPGASGAGPETPVDHGSMGATETVDLGDGTWHRGTLSADCTITVTGWTLGEGMVLLFKVTNGASWGITWDADVVFAGDDQPGQGADAVTWYLLWSDEGDSVLYGAIVGGPSLTVKDDGTPLPTAATSLDFVGDGVTATGSGTAKTITINAAPIYAPVMVEDATSGLWYVAVTGDGDAVLTEVG